MQYNERFFARTKTARAYSCYLDTVTGVSLVISFFPLLAPPPRISSLSFFFFLSFLSFLYTYSLFPASFSASPLRPDLVVSLSSPFLHYYIYKHTTTRILTFIRLIASYSDFILLAPCIPRLRRVPFNFHLYLISRRLCTSRCIYENVFFGAFRRPQRSNRNISAKSQPH